MHTYFTIVCKQCGKSFYVPPYRQAITQFCSYDCRRTWNTAHGKTPTKQICKQCGKEFMAHTSAERLYCSQQCYWKSKERTEPRTCPICEKVFHVSPSEPNRLCSRACRDIWLQNKEERACKQCGKAFTVHPHRPDIYCSPSCASKANNAKRKVTYPIRTCANCGKEFEYKRRDTGGKYCSRACSDSVNKNPPAQEWISKPCVHCGNLFLCPPWHPEIAHCSGKCAQRHRAQTVHGPNHPLWKDKVEMVCEVCGKVCEVKPCLVSRFRACSRRCTGVLATLAQPRISSIERKVEAAMHSAGLQPIPQYVIGPFITDFAFPDQKLVIECDGDYWHGTAKQQAKDRQKDGYLKHSGWRVLRLPEHRILSNIDECVQEVMNFLNSTV